MSQNHIENWDQFWLTMVILCAMKSKDQHTKVGAVIVSDTNTFISMGYNGLPRGCNDDVPERYERPEKYKWMEHAERNAIYNAARIGVSTIGAKMYTHGTPCIDCARAVCQAGIKELIVWEKQEKQFYSNPKWEGHADFSQALFKELGIAFRYSTKEPLQQLASYVDGRNIL